MGSFKKNNCARCNVLCAKEVCSKCRIKIRKEKGECVHCGVPTAGGMTMCDLHLKRQRESNNSNYNPAKKKEYYAENKDKIMKTHLIYEKKKRLGKDIGYRLQISIRRRVSNYLKDIKIGKGNKSVSKSIGCSIEELKDHLWLRFYTNPETGEEMSWDNYGINGWHVDHIVPLSYFNLENDLEFCIANSYQNLQPMWALENIKKSNTTNPHIVWIEDEPYIVGLDRLD